MPRRAVPWAIAALAVLAAAAAIAVPALAGGDDELKRVVVSEFSGLDQVDDKEVQAFCPKGYEVTGGGGGVTHGDDTPSVAMYQSYPQEQSSLVMAHETDPEQHEQAWEMYAVAICVKDG